jgi:hypothetical protein
MPDYIYRLPNFVIMILLIISISVLSIYVPILLQDFYIFTPTQQSIKLGPELRVPYSIGAISASAGLL